MGFMIFQPMVLTFGQWVLTSSFLQCLHYLGRGLMIVVNLSVARLCAPKSPKFIPPNDGALVNCCINFKIGSNMKFCSCLARMTPP